MQQSAAEDDFAGAVAVADGVVAVDVVGVEACAAFHVICAAFAVKHVVLHTAVKAVANAAAGQCVLPGFAAEQDMAGLRRGRVETVKIKRDIAVEILIDKIITERPRADLAAVRFVFLRVITVPMQHLCTVAYVFGTHTVGIGGGIKIQCAVLIVAAVIETDDCKRIQLAQGIAVGQTFGRVCGGLGGQIGHVGQTGYGEAVSKIGNIQFQLCHPLVKRITIAFCDFDSFTAVDQLVQHMNGCFQSVLFVVLRRLEQRVDEIQSVGKAFVLEGFVQCEEQ